MKQETPVTRVSSLIELMKKNAVSRLKVGDIEIEMQIVHTTVYPAVAAATPQAGDEYDEILFHSVGGGIPFEGDQ